MEEINQPSGWPVEETGKASPNHKQEGGGGKRNPRGEPHMRSPRGERTPKKKAGSKANLAGPLVPRMRVGSAARDSLPADRTEPRKRAISLRRAAQQVGTGESELVVTYADRTWQYRRHWTGGISHQRIHSTHTRLAGMQVCDRALLPTRVPTA